MTYVANAKAMQTKPVTQLRTDRFDPFAEVSALRQETWGVRRGRFAVLSHRCYQRNPLFRQCCMAGFVNKAFVGSHKTAHLFEKFLHVLHVVGAGVKEWTVGNHAEERDAQTDFEAVVFHFLRRAVADIGQSLKTFEAEAACESADGVRHGVYDLQSGFVLFPVLHKALPQGVFDLLEVGGLPYEDASFGQVGKEVPIVGGKVGEQIGISVKFEELTADFEGDDLGIGEFRRKSGFSQSSGWGVLRQNVGKFVGDKAVYGDDKIVSVHRAVTFW